MTEINQPLRELPAWAVPVRPEEGPDFLPGDNKGKKWEEEQENKKAEEDKARKRKEYNEDAELRLDALENAKRKREEVALGEGLPDSAAAAYERLSTGVVGRSEFVARERPVPLVQRLIDTNSLAWVAGGSGSFKSFIVADLAFRYASADMSYHNRKMTHGRVLFVVAEGEATFQDRIVAWEKEHKREVENVEFYPEAIQLGEVDRDVAALVHFLARERDAGRPFGLVIFDTQSLCTAGVDENTDMTRIVNVLHRLRRVNGACIMPIHHTGKDKDKGMRGSSALYAAADTVIMAARDKKKKGDGEEDDDEGKPMSVVITTDRDKNGKQKALAEEEVAHHFEMVVHEVGEDYFGDTVTSLVPLTRAAVLRAKDDADEKLPDVTVGRQSTLLALKSCLKISISTTDAASRAGVKRQYALEVLQLLEQDGLVRGQKAGSTYHWNVTGLGLRKIEQLEQQTLLFSPTTTEKHDREVLSGRLSESPG